MDGYAGQTIGDANAAKPPELVAGLERLRRLANSLADLGDQLNSQANRLFGSNEPAPVPTVTNAIPPGASPGGPLLYQISDAFETIERNLARAAAGARRLGDLG